MKRLENTSHSSKGFTLVELVVCMVILGIISTVVLDFLSNGTKFFVETSARTDISVLARNLSLRLERHLANALPYSYNVFSDNKSIEFLEVVGAYRVQKVQKVPKEQNEQKDVAPNEYNVSFFASTNSPFTKMRDRCLAYGIQASEYRLYPAIFSRGDEVVVVKGQPLTTDDLKLTWNEGDSLLSFKTTSDYKSLSEGARIYFLDTCSLIQYSLNSEVLKYQVFKYDPTKDPTKGKEIGNYDLTGIPVKLKELRFSADSTAVSFGFLLMNQDQSIPVSQYVEVTNAP
ncbi:MAG: prepilin-type N-terminal cleavage/methylation domain-containing protein [Succinivibrionaceae bacterium]|nr:prepilin-type N-terminal cleavage/methylation domain-containing protein [Succinivibrionaceae bacterium]